MTNFKYIWALLGDYLSFHYTGTGSTTSDVTIKGKRDINGMFGHGMTSLTRFYN